MSKQTYNVMTQALITKVRRQAWVKVAKAQCYLCERNQPMHDKRNHVPDKPGDDRLRPCDAVYTHDLIAKLDAEGGSDADG